MNGGNMYFTRTLTSVFDDPTVLVLTVSFRIHNHMSSHSQTRLLTITVHACDKEP